VPEIVKWGTDRGTLLFFTMVTTGVRGDRDRYLTSGKGRDKDFVGGKILTALFRSTFAIRTDARFQGEVLNDRLGICN